MTFRHYKPRAQGIVGSSTLADEPAGLRDKAFIQHDLAGAAKRMMVVKAAAKPGTASFVALGRRLG
jgi:hypothetical protein